MDDREMAEYWRVRGRHWDEAADNLAEIADRLNQPFMEALGIAEAQHVLDLASGAGEPALSIARRVGPEGHVVATDLVPEMLAGARRRAAKAGQENIDFRLADMAALPFADASFDRISCRFGIMFVADVPRALEEARRVLRPDGRIGFLIWGPRENTTFFQIFDEAARQVFGAGRVDLDTPFRFGAPDALAGLLRAAGFVGTKELDWRFEPAISDHLPFWRPQMGMFFGPLIDGDEGAARKALDTALAQGFARSRKNAHYRLSMHVKVVLGAR